MASTFHYAVIIFFFISPLISASEPNSQASSKPNALFLPVTKDSATNLHVVNVQKRTPLSSLPLVLDLNGRFLWLNCDNHYLSSTYRAPFCHSTQCSRVGTHYCHTCATPPPRPGCHNNTCGVIATNPLTHRNTIGELALDHLSIQSTRGSNPGPMVTIPQFLFTCAPSSLLQGLPKNVQGIAGVGHDSVALPGQLASHFGFRPRFTLCLASNIGNGVVLFGNWPFKNPRAYTYTPLTVSPQGGYYIQVRSIRINDTTLVPKNKEIITTMISTTAPYTLLQTSIFGALTRVFATQLPGVTRVSPVAPFELCYDSKSLKSTRVGPGVPSVDFVLQNGNVSWRVWGANSMVQAREGVWCLGFVDGGVKPRASIVIGSHQLEDNVVQFDLARSRLGFSYSLLFQSTGCASFNFTSTP